MKHRVLHVIEGQQGESIICHLTCWEDLLLSVACGEIDVMSSFIDLGHGIFIESSPGSVEPVVFLLKELA